MRRSVFKVMISVITCAIMIVCILVGVSIINSKQLAVKEAERSLGHLSDKYAGGFSTVFNDSQVKVNDLAVIAESSFVMSDYRYDRQAFESRQQEVSRMVRGMVNNSLYPMGIYLTFAPENTGGEDEIWYLKDKDGSIKFIDSRPISEGWLIEEDASTEYYFEAIRQGSYWTDAEYDLGMDGEVISYVKAVYDVNDMLIGVVGADIIVDDIFVSLNNIADEINGKCGLYDSRGNFIAGNDIEKYRDKDYIFAESRIAGKWRLKIAQPVSVATEPILKTEAAVILLGVLLIIGIIIFILGFSNRKVRPIIREVEQKDVIMINQSRQAKMGEMVGNIAHQWKQPLNGMKMALSNMQYDYTQDMMTDEDFDTYIEQMKAMTDSLAETVDDFTDFLRPARSREEFCINSEIEKVTMLMAEKIRLQSIELDVHGEELTLEGFRNEFDQCLFNIIDNAADALREASVQKRNIVIETFLQTGGDGKRTKHITVFNNGNHISDENMKRIFDIYFTTKEEIEGTGIGLYLAREIVRLHFFGDITAKNVPGGVKFDISIPSEDGKGEEDGNIEGA